MADANNDPLRVKGNIGELAFVEIRQVAKLKDATMTSTETANNVPGDVRAAIHAFLNTSQKENRPFVISEVLNAVRRIFPDLDISDTDLVDAITSEASTPGFDFEAVTGGDSNTMKQKSLERWDNEGGAVDRASADRGSADDR